ncbi:MAG TPA: nitroreductase family deazaflavin-dependent oxidoreductase [Actinomycetota bacterium]
MVNVEVVADRRSVHDRSRRWFWRHFAEMVVAMLLSMAIFGAAVSGIFALLGHGNLLHYGALRGFLMTIYMVVGMGLWMRHRRHGWASVLEMSAAMIVPYVLLVGPFAAGLLAKGTFLGAMHVLMLPCMYLAMIHRREEYEQGHSGHGRQGHSAHRGRIFARFNRSVANPVTRLFAGWVPPFAVVRHRGRVSGRGYATPVWAFATRDGLVFALLYGTVSDWAKNVLAADEVRVVRRGESRAYALPRLVRANEGQRLVPAILRPPLRLFGVHDFLRVSVSLPAMLEPDKQNHSTHTAAL